MVVVLVMVIVVVISTATIWVLRSTTFSTASGRHELHIVTIIILMIRCVRVGMPRVPWRKRPHVIVSYSIIIRLMVVTTTACVTIMMMATTAVSVAITVVVVHGVTLSLQLNPNLTIDELNKCVLVQLIVEVIAQVDTFF